MNRKTSRRPSLLRRGGFTLIELMMATGISMILVLSLVYTYTQQRYAYKVLQQRNELDQNIRAAIDMMARDIRNAGYGISSSVSLLPSWVDWVSGVSITGYVTTVTSGGNTRLYVTGALEAPVANLNAAISSGSFTITLPSGKGSQFNTGSKKLICIGRTEMARITSISGDTLTLSTSPTTARALRYGYPAGSPVEQIKCVMYEQSNDSYNYPYVPHLRRDDNTGSMPYTWQRMVAGNIDRMVIGNGTGGSVQLTIQGRTSDVDRKYTDPGYNDHFRRKTISTQVSVRKLTL